MTYNVNEMYEYLLTELDSKSIRYNDQIFDSGCRIIDIWYGDLFYVVQIEEDSVGFSIVEEADFGTIPDMRFFDIEKFKIKLRSVFG